MKERVYSMDAIRVLAMILVIIVHTKSNFFNSDVHFAVFAFFKVIGTVGVPLFVILTGYLMFDRNYKDNAYLQRYLSRNLFPLLISYEVWNVAWNILRYTHVAENPQKWSAIFKAAFFMGDTVSALWYLPMTIALYLGMPILSMACHNITSKPYQKALLIALILSGTLIPSVAPLASLVGHNAQIHSVLRMNIFGASVWGESVWMIYLLSGYAIYKGLLKKFKASILILFGIVLPFSCMYAIEFTNHTVQNYDFILVVILSIATFELLTRTEKALSLHEKIRFLIVKISTFSFAVYMMHIFVGGAICRALEKAAGMQMPVGSAFHWGAGLILYAIYIVTIVLIVWFLVSILKKNTFIRRYVLLMK